MIGEASLDQRAGRSAAKDRLKGLSFRTFMALDRLGVHLLPKHYYTPVSDYAWLRANKDAWVGRAPLVGIHWDLDAQMAWLAEICRPYYHEVAGLHLHREMQHYGPGFGPIESQVVHCIVRALAPPRIVEIGSGASTAGMLHAASLNEREGRTPSRITCIEPFPKPALRALADVTHVEQRCQTVPSAVFAQLQSGDLLFIDSSHAVKVGSELMRIYLDVIPRLPSGVVIHIHDVCLPYLYPPTALLDYFGWQETPLLLALLTNNDRLGVLACLSALHHDHPDALAALLTDYHPLPLVDGLAASNDAPGHFPSSLWLRTN